jgi:hypothetical protein
VLRLIVAAYLTILLRVVASIYTGTNGIVTRETPTHEYATIATWSGADWRIIRPDRCSRSANPAWLG